MSMRRRRDPRAESRVAAGLAALADGSLGPERRAELEAEVAASPVLAERLAEQQRAVALARSAAGEVRAPAGLRARIEAQRAGGRAPGRRRLALIGVAATAALAVAIGLSLSNSGGSAVRFQAALAPTALAPDAAGRATLTKTSSGWRIRLEASGLPLLAGGRFYEAWLRNASGVLVPVGTFNEGRNVTLWAGVSPESFPILTVTRETTDGNQASSGEKVLVGRAVSG